MEWTQGEMEYLQRGVREAVGLLGGEGCNDQRGLEVEADGETRTRIQAWIFIHHFREFSFIVFFGNRL